MAHFYSVDTAPATAPCFNCISSMQNRINIPKIESTTAQEFIIWNWKSLFLCQQEKKKWKEKRQKHIERWRDRKKSGKAKNVYVREIRWDFFTIHHVYTICTTKLIETNSFFMKRNEFFFALRNLFHPNWSVVFRLFFPFILSCFFCRCHQFCRKFSHLFRFNTHSSVRIISHSPLSLSLWHNIIAFLSE